MARRMATIAIDVGLRARYAEQFIEAARASPRPVTIGRAGGGRRVDAKSILLVLDLELDEGEEVELEAADAAVLDELVAILSSSPPS